MDTMIRNLDIDLLRSLVTVSQLKSFTDAANVLGRSQSAVSLQIKRLEDIAGGELLQRTRNSISVTRRGELLLFYANRILKTNDEALARLHEPEADGVLRIGAPDDYATSLLPAILAKFSKDYPLVQTEVVCDNSDVLLNNLAQDKLDVVIATHTEDDMRGELAMRQPLHWVAAPDFVDDKEDALPLVLFPKGCVCRSIALEALQQADRAWRISYSTRSISLITSAVKVGSGISVMERCVVPEGVRLLDESDGFPVLKDVFVKLHRRTVEDMRLIDLASDYILRELEQI